MPALVYECIECEYRERFDDGPSRTTFACPRCRGVMKRVGAA
jgi:predicted nucleic acid-binding Zn ribbon protein